MGSMRAEQSDVETFSTLLPCNTIDKLCYITVILYIKNTNTDSVYINIYLVLKSIIIRLF